MRIHMARGSCCISLAVSSVEAVVVDGDRVKPVTTFSIVARDPETGELGVAVQSHWFSVGSTVPWVKAGVGAVATQSLTDVTYGPLGLDLMQAGKTAEQALKGLLETDVHPEWRQVGMIDAKGNRAAHTGKQCIREAGHVIGEDFVVMANLMEKNTVWQAMADAYRNSAGDLAERMLAALDAAQKEGGDIRGRQSAAMIIVRGQVHGRGLQGQDHRSSRRGPPRSSRRAPPSRDAQPRVRLDERRRREDDPARHQGSARRRTLERWRWPPR